MSNKSDLRDEAKRCADIARKDTSPAHKEMFEGLSRFYDSLADTEPEFDRFPSTLPCSFDEDGGRLNAPKPK